MSHEGAKDHDNMHWFAKTAELIGRCQRIALQVAWNIHNRGKNLKEGHSSA